MFVVGQAQRRALVLLAIAVSVCACGSSPAPAGTNTSPVSSASGATAASVAVQPTDVPASLQECAQSGSIDHYLNSIKATDPGTYIENLNIWTRAHAHGAVAAEFVVYADSKAHCLALATAGGPQHGNVPVTYAFLEGMVIQFKDEATAAREYRDSVFINLSPTSFDNVPGGVVGSSTGFGPNSEAYSCGAVIDCGAGPGMGYNVVWQNKSFDVVIGFFNMELVTCKTIALAMNSRTV